ncbi:hypothetical protein SK3146_05691 [Paenibacillus konkukensis]|uniref:Uncharacterized protein n=1 Tax=Paenibacillus konkukensis TaxID=2020716 RepID=A0ABY4RXX6_9BACL|nr:hypothetical protein SK3146_05691 [Paenibacillus konkukensis]
MNANSGTVSAHDERIFLALFFRLGMKLRIDKYEAWNHERFIIDTAHQTVEESLRLLREQLGLVRKG